MAKVPASVICIAASRGFATITPQNAMARSSNESASANGKDSSANFGFEALMPVWKDLAADSPNGVQYDSLGQRPRIAAPHHQALKGRPNRGLALTGLGMNWDIDPRALPHCR